MINNEKVKEKTLQKRCLELGGFVEYFFEGVDRRVYCGLAKQPGRKIQCHYLGEVDEESGLEFRFCLNPLYQPKKLGERVN